MIFLFFGTSVALLEAELAPFKDLEEIGNFAHFPRPGENDPYMETQIRQKVGPGKFLMELKLTTFLIFRRRGSVIPMIHTLKQRGVSIFDIIKLVYLLFQPHVSSGTHLCHGCLPHMPRSTVTCAGCAEG